jgi:uncharacterized protein (TIGR02246 family)
LTNGKSTFENRLKSGETDNLQFVRGKAALSVNRASKQKRGWRRRSSRVSYLDMQFAAAMQNALFLIDIEDGEASTCNVVTTWLKVFPLPRQLGCYRRLGENPHQVCRRQIILNPRQEKVKMRLLITLVGLAIGFVIPAFGQTKETVDPQTKVQLDGLTQKFATALDSNDASQMADVFAKDAVYVTNKGPLHGQEEIQNYFADLFKHAHISDHWASVDTNSLQVLGPDKVWRNGEWCTTVQLPDGSDPEGLERLH